MKRKKTRYFPRTSMKKVEAEYIDAVRKSDNPKLKKFMQLSKADQRALIIYAEKGSFGKMQDVYKDSRSSIRNYINDIKAKVK